MIPSPLSGPHPTPPPGPATPARDPSPAPPAPPPAPPPPPPPRPPPPGGRPWRQPFSPRSAQPARSARGEALGVEPVAPQIDTKKYGPVPALTAAASYDPETGSAALFAVNRDRHAPLELTVDLRA